MYEAKKSFIKKQQQLIYCIINKTLIVLVKSAESENICTNDIELHAIIETFFFKDNHFLLAVSILLNLKCASCKLT